MQACYSEKLQYNIAAYKREKIKFVPARDDLKPLEASPKQEIRCVRRGPGAAELPRLRQLSGNPYLQVNLSQALHLLIQTEGLFDGL
jgi:hypothetical protein